MSEVYPNADEVFERIDDAVFGLDDEWRFTFLNARAAELIDVDREHVVGDVVWDVFEPAVGTTFQAEYERAMEAQESVSFEEYYPPLETWFEVTAYPSETGLSVYFRDVTERKERERELEQYRSLTRAASDVIVTIDAESTIEAVNPAVSDVFGYDPDELVGEKLTTLMPEEYRDSHLDGIETYLETGERQLDWEYVELPGLTADGDEIPLAISFSEADHEGDRYFTGIVRDISERKERERELGRLQDLLEQTERVADVGGWEIDIETMDVFWTEHLFDLLQVEYDEEPPLDEALDVYHEADRQLVEDAIETSIESGDSFDIEARFLTPSEEVRWLRIQGIPKTEGGEVVTLRGAAQDVTERKEHEQQLKRARDRAQALFENSPDMIHVLGMDGEFLAVNQGSCDALGYEEAELLGRPATEFDTSLTESDVRELFEEMEAGDSRRFESECVRRDGSTFPVEANLTRIQLGDQPRILAVVRDITERKARERELEKQVRQQEVVTDLGQHALSTHDVDELMDEAARLVAGVLDTDYCKVLDLDDAADELLLRQGVGWDDGIVGTETVSAVDRDSQAAHTLDSREPIVVEDLDTESRFSGPPLLTSHDVRSGISTIIGPDDDPWGILGTHDTDPRSFSEQDVNFVQSVANTLAAAISRHHSEQLLRNQRDRLSALNDINSLVHGLAESMFGLSSKADIEDLVCDRLADSTSYEFAWIGTVEDGEIATATEAGVEGYLDDISLRLDEPPGNQGPTVRAHRTGEMQVVQDTEADPRYEPWRDRAREYGYRASAAIPISDGDDVYSTLNVYSSRPEAFDREERDALRRLGSIVGYALSSVERDRELQRERNRLEFMNRLLRHNLLNSLNVVEARLDIVDGRVDYEVSQHLDTAINRTDEMIDFVQTVRKVASVIGNEEHQELEPVDVGDVLTTRVKRAQESYPEAEYHLESAPSVDVVADELLGEVLDNVLVNAVQHNSREDPSVWVDVTAEDDDVVVSVADNGPGIPDEHKDAVFDQESRDFDDPGTGFGLYIVQEIIDSYGGSISVEDNDPDGALFRLTFRRA